jgi:hypothetical protein
MSSLSRLEKYTKDLVNPDPIFFVEVLEQGTELRLKLADYEKPSPIEGDVLSELVHKSIEIRLKTPFIVDGYTIDIKKTLEKAACEIKHSICLMLENNLHMKNPRQSKLYRWLRYLIIDSPPMDDVILVYQYVKPFCDSDMKPSSEENRQHVANAITLLQALMEKHDGK